MFAVRRAVTTASASPKFGVATIRLASTAVHAKPEVKNAVESSIIENKVMIFSKTHCPHSTKARNLFASEYPGIPVEVVELDEVAEGSSMQAYLLEKTGQRTVPNIFIDQQHIGGCDTVHALNSRGKLAALLKTAPISASNSAAILQTITQTPA